MPRAEQDRLFSRWQTMGDESARDELVRQYLPLAHRLARRYWGAHEPLDDLRQVASVGLLKAINRHDSSRGTSFQTFAVPTILGELKRYFRDCGWAVHLPRGTQELALKAEKAKRAIEADGRTPTLRAIAEYLEMTVEEVHDANEAAAAHHASSMDAPTDDGEGDTTTLGDAMGTIDAGYERVEEDVVISQATRKLSHRERRVLALRYVSDMTQTQIATEIGVSQMQVSRILHGALDRISVDVAAEDM